MGALDHTANWPAATRLRLSARLDFAAGGYYASVGRTADAAEARRVGRRNLMAARALEAVR